MCNDIQLCVVTGFDFGKGIDCLFDFSYGNKEERYTQYSPAHVYDWTMEHKFDVLDNPVEVKVNAVAHPRDTVASDQIPSEVNIHNNYLLDLKLDLNWTTKDNFDVQVTRTQIWYKHIFNEAVEVKKEFTKKVRIDPSVLGVEVPEDMFNSIFELEKGQKDFSGLSAFFMKTGGYFTQTILEQDLNLYMKKKLNQWKFSVVVVIATGGEVRLEGPLIGCERDNKCTSYIKKKKKTDSDYQEDVVILGRPYVYNATLSAKSLTLTDGSVVKLHHTQVTNIETNEYKLKQKERNTS
eukprot:GHVR01156565.1.p1 GENE.GHVR01156565.1~~GHVR01156565.1.p1  ORF type:complete len:294 (+),score=38.18 GHVR01156565.1:385-1266(+)